METPSRLLDGFLSSMRRKMMGKRSPSDVDEPSTINPDRERRLRRILMERSEDWMNQANSDLDHAELSMSRQHYDWSCFASQQAAEKAVKGLFQNLGISAWGCSIADLLEDYRSQEGNNVPNGLYDAALELDKMFYSTRYPDQHPTRHPHDRYTRSEAQRAIEKAKNVVKFCSEICMKNGKPETEEESEALSRVRSNTE